MAASAGRGAFVLAHATLLALVLVALACIAAFGRNIPLAEDWNLVGPLTGTEPDLAAWLWSQNNEHRLPLPRLVLLGVTAAAGGDFRAGMVLNVLTLGGLALAMLWAARRLRGGRQHLADVVLPLLLLHLGHWENLVWSWQFQFVCSAALSGTVLVAVVLTAPGARGPERAAAAAVVLLPLTGANGLVVALPMVLWLALLGATRLAAAEAWGAGRGGALLPLGAAAAALLLGGAYFSGWERPTWVEPAGTLRQVLRTLEFYLAYGFGPGGRWLRHPAAARALLLLASGALLAARAAWRGPAAERPRALGILAFLAGAGGLALAIAWGRSGVRGQMPDRYALFSVMGLLGAWYAWQLYGAARQRRIVARLVALAVLVMLPFNLRAGWEWRGWYDAGMGAVEADLAAGVPRLELAERHRVVLMHWNEAFLADAMGKLRDAGLGPFRALRD
ncbi:MAG TPA: hypothetical protein VFG43_07250 [Geminicoccaceae bacterium]|nr:hypothetical protein [Geminicoccaceae bacterium]